MLEAVISVFKFIFYLIFPFILIFVGFMILCAGWFIWFRMHGKKLPALGQVKQKKHSLFRQILIDAPRRYVLDQFNREPGFFSPKGIHMFCGEQGSGKTISAVEMMLRLQKQYPAAKMITNFGVKSEDKMLSMWQQLLTYNNGHQGVIVGIDELQNWFMSGKNQLPPEMLEVVTQNRKNCRILCCTAQVFTRVNKGIREQVTMVYQPHTVLGCFTFVIKRKPVFDSEGNVIDLKYRGFYSFVHTEELRNSYDTYKVIHSLASEGFKEMPNDVNISIYNQSKSR